MKRVDLVLLKSCREPSESLVPVVRTKELVCADDVWGTG